MESPLQHDAKPQPQLGKSDTGEIRAGLIEKSWKKRNLGSLCPLHGTSILAMYCLKTVFHPPTVSRQLSRNTHLERWLRSSRSMYKSLGAPFLYEIHSLKFLMVKFALQVTFNAPCLPRSIMLNLLSTSRASTLTVQLPLEPNAFHSHATQKYN